MTLARIARQTRAALRLNALERLVSRVDPCRDPAAERVSLSFVVVFLGFAAWALWLLWRFPYEPGQDIPYHTFCTRVVADWGKPGSPYTARYEPLHPTEANTFLYFVGGMVGRWFDVARSFHALRAVYFVGLPLAVLYGLRRLGRSPWPAIVAFATVYAQGYSAGFANFQFAAPTFVMAIVTYIEFFDRPSVPKGLAVSVLFAVVFVSHAHVYLWLGALLTMVTLHGVGRELTRSDGLGLEHHLAQTGKRLALAVLAAGPSLVLFGRWYARTYGAGKAVGRDEIHAGASAAFGADWYTPAVKLGFGPIAGASTTKDPHELWFLIALTAMVLVALALGRLERQARPPIMELLAIATVVSYFVLPDSISRQQVALRAWDMGGWLVAFLVVPVAARTSRAARVAIIGGIIAFSGVRLRVVERCLMWFNEREMAGFAEVARGAPPGDHLVAYAVMDPQSSYFTWDPLGQLNALLAAKRGYEAPLYISKKDSNLPLRYESGPPAQPTLIVKNPDWSEKPGLWDAYDLVLVRGWKPTPAQLEHARSHASLVAHAGAFQLWQRK